MTEEKKEAVAVEEPPKKSHEEHLESARKNQEKIDAENPRFKEVYGKMKDHERVLAEKEKDIEAMRDHMLSMEKKVSEIIEKKADKTPLEEPDPIVDPEAHRAWVKLNAMEASKKAAQREEEREVKLAVRLQAAEHEDYDEVIKIADKEIARDLELRKKIWADPVAAPAKAYRLGKKIMAERDKVETDEKERQERLKKAEVLNDGGEGGGSEETPLTDDQKRVIKNLYRDIPFKDAEKRYRASMKSMGVK